MRWLFGCYFLLVLLFAGSFVCNWHSVEKQNDTFLFSFRRKKINKGFLSLIFHCNGDRCRKSRRKRLEREREKIKTQTNDTLCFVVELFFCTCLTLGCCSLLWLLTWFDLSEGNGNAKKAVRGERVPRTILSANDLKFITKFRATIFSSTTFSTKINELTFHC